MYSVLYVDDEPVLLELGKTFLEMSGSLKVETALSAADAIAFLKSNPVDCIISDYQMPEMDGIVFLKYIRAHAGPLPFILFTGRGREEVVIEAFSHAADFYLQKGGDPTAQFVELEHKVKLAVERRKTKRNSMTPASASPISSTTCPTLPLPSTSSTRLSHGISPWRR